MFDFIIFINAYLFIYFYYSNEEQITTLNNDQKPPEESVKGKFRYILSRPPLHDINQYSKFKFYLFNFYFLYLLH